jgi:hypothetical protein
MIQIAHAAGMKVTGVYNAVAANRGLSWSPQEARGIPGARRDRVTVGLLYFSHRIPFDQPDGDHWRE